MARPIVTDRTTGHVTRMSVVAAVRQCRQHATRPGHLPTRNNDKIIVAATLRGPQYSAQLRLARDLHILHSCLAAVVRYGRAVLGRPSDAGVARSRHLLCELRGHL